MQFDKPQLAYWYVKQLRAILNQAIEDTKNPSDILKFDTNVYHGKYLLEALDFYLDNHPTDFDEMVNKNLNEAYKGKIKYERR